MNIYKICKFTLAFFLLSSTPMLEAYAVVSNAPIITDQITNVPVVIRELNMGMGNALFVCPDPDSYFCNDIPIDEYHCPKGTIKQILWSGGYPSKLLCIKY